MDAISAHSPFYLSLASLCGAEFASAVREIYCALEKQLIMIPVLCDAPGDNYFTLFIDSGFIGAFCGD